MPVSIVPVLNVDYPPYATMDHSLGTLYHGQAALGTRLERYQERASPMTTTTNGETAGPQVGKAMMVNDGVDTVDDDVDDDDDCMK